MDIDMAAKQLTLEYLEPITSTLHQITIATKKCEYS